MPGTAGSFTVQVEATDAESGIEAYEFEDPGAGWTVEHDGASATYSFDATALPPATPPRVVVRNRAGVERATSLPIRADTAPPAAAIRCDGAPCSTEPYSAVPLISLDGDDGEGSGAIRLEFSVDGGAPTTPADPPRAVDLRPGTTTIRVRAIDRFGHTGPEAERTIRVVADPVDVTPSLDVPRAVKQRIGTAGGTLTATDAAGNTLELAIPDGALAGEQEIVLTPLAGVAGLPFADGLRAGADLAPDGLRLWKAATLVIRTPADQPPPPLAIASFSAKGDGRDFHLAPLAPGPADARVVRMLITHFSVAGFSGATAPERETMLQRAPGGAEDQLVQKLTDVLLEERHCQMVVGCDRQQELYAAKLALMKAGWPRIAAVLAAAEADDGLTDRALAAAYAWQRQVEFTILPEDMAAELAAVKAAPARILNAAWDRWVARCRMGNLQAPARLMSIHHQAQLLLSGDTSRFRLETVEKCLSFRLRATWVQRFDYPHDPFQRVKREVKVDIPIKGEFGGAYPEYVSYESPSLGTFLGRGGCGAMAQVALAFHTNTLLGAEQSRRLTGVGLAMGSPSTGSTPYVPGQCPFDQGELFETVVDGQTYRRWYQGWLDHWAYLHSGELTRQHPRWPSRDAYVLEGFSGGAGTLGTKTYHLGSDSDWLYEDSTFTVEHEPIG